MKVCDIKEWKKMGTGRKTKEEILQNVTYIKIDTTNDEITIRNLPYEEPVDYKISWKDKEYKVITNDLNEAINIISTLVTKKYE